MSELKKAIEEIMYEGEKFPARALKTIVDNRDESLPYLRNAIEKAIAEGDDLEEDFQLHFYAVFLLGELQDRESFPKIIELMKLPDEVLDYLLGDTITSGLNDIFYNMYNGNIELLKNTIMDKDVNEYVRAGLLDVMGQLYLDGVLEEKEWRGFIRQNVHSGKEHNYIYDALAAVICRCHFVDMLPEIRYMLDNNLMDEMYMGKYDSCVDEMFAYREYEQNFCESSINTIDRLKSWAMFENNPDEIEEKRQKKDFEKLIKAATNNLVEQKTAKKIGRNDPCPCGSGKKFKFCCLNKPKAPIDFIESVQEREKWMKCYPYLGTERQENRVYLDDYFDSESIEIDKLLYLGIMHRPGLIWLKDEQKEEKRKREYLTLAFRKFVDKIKKENISTFEEYDQNYSIHYLCKQWLDELSMLLRKNGDMNLRREVEKYKKELSR